MTPSADTFSPDADASTSPDVEAVTPLEPYTRVVGDERAALTREFVRRYESGESIRSIAASHGRSYGSTYQMLIEAGVQFRPRGGTRPRRKARPK